MISWMIFYYPTLGQAFSHIGAMFGLGGVSFMDAAALQTIKTYSVFPVLAFVASLPVGNLVQKLLSARLNPRAIERLKLIWLSAVLVLSVLFLVGQSYNPFIYFQF